MWKKNPYNSAQQTRVQYIIWSMLPGGMDENIVFVIKDVAPRDPKTKDFSIKCYVYVLEGIFFCLVFLKPFFYF